MKFLKMRNLCHNIFQGTFCTRSLLYWFSCLAWSIFHSWDETPFNPFSFCFWSFTWCLFCPHLSPLLFFSSPFLFFSSFSSFTDNYHHQPFKLIFFFCVFCCKLRFFVSVFCWRQWPNKLLFCMLCYRCWPS